MLPYLPDHFLRTFLLHMQGILALERKRSTQVVWLQQPVTQCQQAKAIQGSPLC